jgi:hypothetical protein
MRDKNKMWKRKRKMEKKGEPRVRQVRRTEPIKKRLNVGEVSISKSFSWQIFAPYRVIEKYQTNHLVDIFAISIRVLLRQKGKASAFHCLNRRISMLR